MTYRALASTLALVVVSGCPEDDTPTEAPDCAFAGGTAEEDPALQVGAPLIEIGTGSGAAFVAWADGDSVPVTQGGQGFSMLTPTLRVRDQAGLGGACLHVSAQLGEDAEFGGVSNAYEFEPRGEHLEAGPIFVPLDGGSVQLRAVVTHDAQWQGVVSVDVTPDY